MYGRRSVGPAPYRTPAGERWLEMAFPSSREARAFFVAYQQRYPREKTEHVSNLVVTTGNRSSVEDVLNRERLKASITPVARW